MSTVQVAAGSTYGSASNTNPALRVSLDGGLTAAYRAAKTITRPANATPYTANDVVGGVLTFPSMGPVGGSVLISGISLELDITAVPAGMTTFRLYLYSATPASALADNAAWDLAAIDRPAFLGYVDMGTPVDLGSTLFVQTNGVNKPVLLSTSDTSLYGYLVTAGAFTPAANSEVYVATLHGYTI